MTTEYLVNLMSKCVDNAVKKVECKHDLSKRYWGKGASKCMECGKILK